MNEVLQRGTPASLSTCDPRDKRHLLLGRLDGQHVATRQRGSRSGGLLLCVMVVLLLVGLISSQAIQTLLLVRRGDHQRREIRQTRELLELGKLVLLNDQVPDSRIFEITLEGQPATVRFIDVGSTEFPRTRIVAQLSANKNREITASWESPK